MIKFTYAVADPIHAGRLARSVTVAVTGNQLFDALAFTEKLNAAMADLFPGERVKLITVEGLERPKGSQVVKAVLSTIAGVLVASSLLLGPSQVQAAAQEPTINWDAQAEMDRYLIVDLYLRTATCMRDATQAMLRQGERSRASIHGFVMAKCTAPLRIQLLVRSRWSANETETFLKEMAHRAIDSFHTPNL